MNKKDFEKRIIWAVELEDDCGRFWTEVRGSEELDKFINKKVELGYFVSDVDYCTKQDDDIREFLDEAEKIWFYGDGRKEFQSLSALIDSLLEKDCEKKEKVWSESEIKELVQVNDKVLYGALKKLYECQTDDEKIGKHTNECNGKGFNKFDAEFLTSVAEFLIRNGYLTERQKVVTRKKIVKYNKQLTKLANKEV